MTAGIKLSNLSLRDGDNVWIPFKDWKVGDLVNGLESTASIQNGVSIGDFLKNREGYVTVNEGNLVYQTEDGAAPTTIHGARNLRIWKNGSNINFQYNNNGTWSTLSSVVDTDTNTTYTLRTETRSDGDYLIFTPSTGNPTSIKLPEPGGGSDIKIENYYAELIAGSGNDGSGGGSGGGSVVVPITGDGTTISISNNTVSLVPKTVSETRTSTSIDFEEDFSYVKNISVDSYGRVESISKETITFPALNNNSRAYSGVVAAGGNNYNKVWKTDGSGNPGWRDETAQISYAGGTAISISAVSGNTRTISLATPAKTIHIGTTASAPTYASLCIIPD